jgi:hypothetical protein
VLSERPQLLAALGPFCLGKEKPAVSAVRLISHLIPQMLAPADQLRTIGSTSCEPAGAKKFAAASVAVYALAPIFGLHSRWRPGTGPAKTVLISHECIRGFRAKRIGIPNSFARVGLVVPGEVFARRGGICDRRNNQSRANQAKDRGSHYGSEN